MGKKRRNRRTEHDTLDTGVDADGRDEVLTPVDAVDVGEFCGGNEESAWQGGSGEEAQRTLILALVVVRPTDDSFRESQLFGSVTDRVVVKHAEVVTEVMLKTVFDMGVVDDAAAQTGGKGGKSTGGVSDEKLEVWVTVKNTSEDEAGDSLSTKTSQQRS
jgi:hypothetical protein